LRDEAKHSWTRRLRKISAPAINGLMQRWFRIKRSMTIGVRAMVFDSSDRILLVQPRLSDVWILPGGGVERGETAVEALQRELTEEAAITLAGAPKLFAVYSLEREFRGDHVLLYVVREFEAGQFLPSMEVRQARFFDRSALPEGVTAGTKRRIAEVLDNDPTEASW
jgi:ADP-ribose pyrophosphatase YjhB (NUDIX family)